MKIINLRDQKKISSIQIRTKNIKNVKYCKGTDSDTSIDIEIYTFPDDLTFYCCIKENNVFGRFIEVTAKFYDTIDLGVERDFSDNFKLSTFRLTEF